MNGPPQDGEKASASPGRPWTWNSPATLAGLLLAFLVFVFLFAPVTVSQDGYSHMYGAYALRQMWKGQPDFRAHFQYNSFLVPNWLAAITLAALESIVPNEIALKLLVVGTAAALLFSLYYCIDARRYSFRERAQILIVLLPFAVNRFLTLGYFGFLVSSALCIIAFGLILRRGLHGRLQLGIAGLLLGAYFFHVFPVVVSFLFLGAYLISVVFPEKTHGWTGTLPVLGKTLAAIWPWAILGALAAWFSSRLTSNASPLEHPSLATVKTRTLLLMMPESLLALAPTATTGLLFVTFLSILAAAVLPLARKPPSLIRLRFRTLAILLLVTLALYFVAPAKIGDGLGIPDRVLLYSAFFLVLLTYSQEAMDTRLLTVSCWLAAVLTLSFGLEYLLVARRLSPALQQLRTVTKSIPPYSRALLLGYRMTPSCKGWPLLERTFPDRHWAMSAAAAANLVVLNDYEATTTHFPLQYRDLRFAPLVMELDPASEEQKAAWIAALSRDDPEVDYVVSWGVPSGVNSCPAAVGPPFEQDFAIHYDRILSQDGNSRIEVWRRKK